MSYFSLINFINSGKKSLEDGNYWSALSVALMLPSMCSRIAFANEKDKYMNFKWNDKSDHSNGKIYTDWKDRDCYIDFCQSIFRNNLYFKSCIGENYAEILYQLRCDIVHSGTSNIYLDGKKMYLSIGKQCGVGCNSSLSKCHIISVDDICHFIFNDIMIWCNSHGADDLKYTRVFDLNNRDDNLLYQRLCENDYKDYLEEQFNKDNERKD